MRCGMYVPGKYNEEEREVLKIAVHKKDLIVPAITEENYEKAKKELEDYRNVNRELRNRIDEYIDEIIRCKAEIAQNKEFIEYCNEIVLRYEVKTEIENKNQ